MIINDLELSNVTFLHHYGQESDDDLGGRSQKNLAFASSFSVINGLERVREDIHTNHLEFS